jgi:cobalamin biosynthesis protein CbiG
MTSDAVIPELAGLSGANLMAVEHAELVVALYTAVTALDESGLHQEASAARAVLHGMAIRAFP